MKVTLRALRVNAGLSLVKACKALGINKNTLCDYEKGRRSPRIELIKKFQDLYGCEYDDIIFLHEDTDIVGKDDDVLGGAD